jgi:hypothetical protein
MNYSILCFAQDGPLKGIACIERFFPEMFTARFDEAVSAMERSEKRIQSATT